MGFGIALPSLRFLLFKTSPVSCPPLAPQPLPNDPVHPVHPVKISLPHSPSPPPSFPSFPSVQNPLASQPFLPFLPFCSKPSCLTAQCPTASVFIRVHPWLYFSLNSCVRSGVMRLCFIVVLERPIPHQRNTPSPPPPAPTFITRPPVVSPAAHPRDPCRGR